MAKIVEPKEKGKMRYLALIIGLLLVFGLYTARLVKWQLVEGEEYESLSQSQANRFIRLTAARGQILDSEGEVLVGNKLTYGVVFNAINVEGNMNTSLLKLIKIFKSQNEEWIDSFPIVLSENGEYVFDEEMESEIEYLKSSRFLNLQEYATAEDCMKALITRFNCNGYSNEDTRDLLSIRYSMHKNGFGWYTPYTISEDISTQTIGIINERSSELPGVETQLFVTRYYGEDPSIAPHLVGTVGVISEKSLEKELEAGNGYSETNVTGYTTSDRIGNSGIEWAFEKELRGTFGKRAIVTDQSGDEANQVVVESPKAGNNVKLTLRSDIQAVANKALEENVKNNTDSTRAVSGGAVMLDVKDGGILAAATYPSFDLDRYYNDVKYYNQLNEDESYPLFNKAFDGTYTPGSVFKPLVAMAALEEGAIGSGTTFYCNGSFNYYDATYGCLGNHGYIDVYGALCRSCNVFFYQTGLAAGIESMDAYAKYFGLGEKTGVEIGEARGVMSSPKLYEDRGGFWTGGNVAISAIGQLDSSFSPLQLATYCMTIVNNGTRYQTHLLDEILDYKTGEVIESYEPKVVMDANISSATMNVVKSGMRMAASEGTAAKVFADYEYSVAAKTGTAETSSDGSKPAHLTFIAYAPADDPQVAVAVVMEYGNKGEYAMNVARDMLDAYFGIDRSGDKNDDDGEGSGSSGSDVDETGSSPSPSPTPVPQPTGDIGAFFHPEKDIPTPTPTPSPEGDSNGGAEDTD